MPIDDPKTYRFTPSEAARLAGMTVKRFTAHVRCGAYTFPKSGRKYLLTDAEAYSLVTGRYPSIGNGKAAWVTCGRHTFMAKRGLDTCPECRKPMVPLRDRTMLDLLAAGSEEMRRCRRCGKMAHLGYRRRYCQDCLEAVSVTDGSRKQGTWDGTRHTCCGSRSSWRHKGGCMRPRSTDTLTTSKTRPGGK